jgi:hypothetical protein
MLGTLRRGSDSFASANLLVHKGCCLDQAKDKRATSARLGRALRTTTRLWNKTRLPRIVSLTWTFRTTTLAERNARRPRTRCDVRWNDNDRRGEVRAAPFGPSHHGVPSHYNARPAEPEAMSKPAAAVFRMKTTVAERNARQPRSRCDVRLERQRRALGSVARHLRTSSRGNMSPRPGGAVQCRHRWLDRG